MASRGGVTITEVVAPMETMHLRLQNKANTGLTAKPPNGPKPTNKAGRLRLDPLRALEPARKKLSTLEAQRIMAVLLDSIKKSEIVTCLPYILNNLERFKISLGAELTQMLEEHRVIIKSFEELQGQATVLRNKEQEMRAAEERRRQEEDEDEYIIEVEDSFSRPNSGGSFDSKLDMTMKSLQQVARQMQHSCKNILRAFSNNPSAMTAVLKDSQDRSQPADDMLGEMKELKDIIMGMLLTTPTEEIERNQYLQQVTERERKNAVVIQKLEQDLKLAEEDRDTEIKKKNDVIRRLQADLHQIEKFSEEHVQRTKTEAEKQEAADIKSSDGKKVKLQQDMNQCKSQLSTLITEHRESEGDLRRKKYKFETEVENWIQKFDQDMGERQDEYEEIDEVYTKEKKELNELEERFKTLEAEYKQIMEERRIARERREAAERELAMCIKAATTIQAFWRSFKVRKAIKSKKKKGGKKKGKK